MKKDRIEQNLIALWFKICSDYYNEGIDYEQLKEVGITLDTKNAVKNNKK